MQAQLTALKEGEWTLRAGVRALLAELRRVVLRHQGVLRASMLEAHGSTWPRLQARRYAFIEEAMPVLLRLHAGPDTTLAERRLRIAFQFAIGSIINAMLNNPGPLRLVSRQFDEELTRAFCAYLSA